MDIKIKEILENLEGKTAEIEELFKAMRYIHTNKLGELK